jgi:hypothetical protein
MKEKMASAEENYVALFIDWDNLAISTAVDFAGAVPDVKAIVRAAQRSGTVLTARAYAEWNVSSDRLSVYRAGVEPVYAPTFRFEPEPGSQVPRGKSLADPCLVTDCIDTMHLMPEINVFVLVSGDKDLIPIVRLAQLRGKKVVVIGPDFVAAILREMADEYIPYRVLADTSDTTPTEVSLHGPRGPRRIPAGPRSTSLPPAQSVRSQPPARSQTSSFAARPAPVETNESVPAETVTPVPPLPSSQPALPEVEPVAEPVPPAEALDTGPLLEIIAGILREREQSGKPRLRAANLKDQLLARMTGFEERRYGFARFKDLLAAAEKAGVMTVSRTGPVQWVTAPSASATGAPTTTSPAAETVAVAPVPPVAALAPVAAPAPPAAPVATAFAPATEEDVDVETVRYILELRERSRWLTYTYVLTNLLNHLGKGSADAAADSAARTTLNRLVQSGILIVDREPREIDVNGARHRVRLCHLVDTHPLVARVLTQLAAEGPRTEAESPTPVEEQAAPTETLSTESDAETSAPAEPPAVEEEVAIQAAEPEPVTDERPEPPDPEAAVHVGESAPAPAAPADTGLEVAGEAEPEAVAVDPAADNGRTATVSPLSLAESYEVLREVVREATGPNRPSTGPAAVKNRLVRKLGAFDEHTFGFSKFKDYLLSAERAGAVKVEMVGTTARVSLPASGEPTATP